MAQLHQHNSVQCIAILRASIICIQENTYKQVLRSYKYVAAMTEAEHKSDAEFPKGIPLVALSIACLHGSSMNVYFDNFIYNCWNVMLNSIYIYI